MDTFLKTSAIVMIALVLCLVLSKQTKDISMLLSMAVCVMLSLTVLTLLDPVFELFRSLEDMGKLNSEMIRILLKAVGIGLIGEITAALCADSGMTAPGKALRLLSSTVILWLSVPLFRTLIDLIQEMLTAV